MTDSNENYIVREYDTHKVKIFDNRVEWFDLDDNLHNEYGPAIVFLDSPDQHWFKHGLSHRVNGPACKISKFWAWSQNDKLHRLDGQAIMYADGGGEYHIEGIEFSKEDFLKRVEELKCLESV